MHQALPQIERYHLVPLGALAQGWPSEELSLTIDAGAPEAVTLGHRRTEPAQRLRSGRLTFLAAAARAPLSANSMGTGRGDAGNRGRPSPAMATERRGPPVDWSPSRSIVYRPVDIHSLRQDTGGTDHVSAINIGQAVVLGIVEGVTEFLPAPPPVTSRSLRG
ncbi:hypothetical protein SANTM175S_02142 [Streptomyces antimycoticus]